MCGIAGIVDPRLPSAKRESAVARMCAAMAHRGPDDDGIASLGPATLGMRRLAIFDPAHGHQPMQSPDGRFTLVFNGAIYNHRALRAELAAGQWAFRTHCDTEVLLAAFARWGADCLSRLRGMFAFGVWDARAGELFLARDPFGIKPLYYCANGPGLVFTSELNALRAAGLGALDIDPQAVADYLAWLAVPAPRTIYRGVRSLRPGESAVFRAGQFALRTHWSFGSIPADDPPCRTRVQFIGELREHLEDTIRAHVLADVPVGAFLSGGLDSAAVVGLMTRAGGGRLRTFSIDFAETGYSEAGAAAATARHFDTDHHTTPLTGADVARDMAHLVQTLDQPTGDGINTYYVSRAARAGGVTVALSGLGGDELFGGYPSFRDTPRLARWLPAWRAVPPALRAPVLARLRRGDTRRRKLGEVLARARSVHEVAAMQRRVLAESAIAALLAPDVQRELAVVSPFHPALESLENDLPADRSFELVSAWELRTYLADVLLRDSDVMSMRHSLELRVPFIDRPLIAWLWRQPAECKRDSHYSKSALREALRDLLPPDLQHRRKWGFALPMTTWMKRELRPFLDDTFAPASVGQSGLFAPAEVQKLWATFLHGHDPREWSRVWSLAMAIAFANRRPTVATITPPGSSSITGSNGDRGQSGLDEPPRHRDTEIAPRISAPSSVPPGLCGSTDWAPDRTGTAPVAPARAPTSTLFLVPEIFSSEGGIPRILRTYLQALCELAAPDGAVHLLALNDPAISAADLAKHASPCLAGAQGFGRRKARFAIKTVQVGQSCDRLVCGHVFMLPAAWLARQSNPRLKYYLIAHGIDVWRPFSLAERLALRGAERILCVSDYTRRELLRHCPLPDGRAVVVPNALDPAFRIEAGRPLAECEPFILLVTRLSSTDRYKGVEHMIAAMPAIRAAVPAARLRIIGRGDDQPRLQALVGELGVTGAVDFLGYVDDARLSDELRQCRLFALPSRKEGFGLVFLEAMAHGRPCLGARAGGVPEVITAETGLLVEYGDVPALAAAAIDALGRSWDQENILARAAHFSYPQFKAKLDVLLAA